MLQSLRSPHFTALWLTVAVATSAQQAHALAASPFQKFIGVWSGGGQIVESNRHRESIRCRAEYSEAKDGSALNQGIVCASESFKLDIKSYVGSIRGFDSGIRERNSARPQRASNGTYRRGRFEGEISAAAFTAGISLTSNGHSQAVSIKPRSGDVSDVRIELKRNG